MTLGSSIVPKTITFQVADVHTALLSISRGADLGYECHLGKDGGFLEDQISGERIPLVRQEHLHMLRTWVRQDPFVRQE